MFKRKTIAAAAALAGLAGAAFAFSPSPATGSSRSHDVWRGQQVSSLAEALRVTHAKAPNTLTVVNVGVAQRQIDLGDPDLTPGDFFEVNLRLFDETGQTVIGRGVVRCEFAISTQNCEGTMRIYKHGQISVSGVFYPDSESAVALSILGGTGEYRGAGGVMRVVDTPDEGLLVFHFTP